MDGIATMTVRGQAGGFDAGAARRDLVRGVVITFLITAVSLAGIVFLVGRADWWRGYVAATVAAGLAAGLSLVPLWKGLGKGMSAMVPAVMAATGVRTLVALGACVLAVMAAGYPATATFMLVVPFYAALLWIETTTLVKLSATITKQQQDNLV